MTNETSKPRRRRARKTPDHWPIEMHDWITRLADPAVPIKSRHIPADHEGVMFDFHNFLKICRECDRPLLAAAARTVTQTYVLKFHPPAPPARGSVEFRPRSDSRRARDVFAALQDLEIDAGLLRLDTEKSAGDQPNEQTNSGESDSPALLSAMGFSRGSNFAGDTRNSQENTPTGEFELPPPAVRQEAITSRKGQSMPELQASDGPRSVRPADPAPASPSPQDAPSLPVAPLSALSIYGLPPQNSAPARPSDFDRLASDYAAIRTLSGPTAARDHVLSELRTLNLPGDEQTNLARIITIATG